MLTVSNMRTKKGIGIGEQTVMGRLKAVERSASRSLALEGATIAMLYEKEAALALLDEAREEILGFVYLGDFDEEIESAARCAGICGLFAELDEHFVSCCGELAILYPQKSKLVISPNIEALQSFAGQMRYDELSPSGAHAEHNKYLYASSDCSMCGLLDEEFCGCLVDIPLGALCEEELFEIFRDFAEFCDGKETVICIGRDTLSRTEHNALARALLRASLHGRIKVALSASERHAAEEFCERLRAAEKSLIREEIEFDQIISLGMIVDSLDALIYTLCSPKKCDFIVFDAQRLYAGQNERESAEQAMQLLRDKYLRRGGRIIIVGESERGKWHSEEHSRREIFVAGDRF